MKTIIFKMVLVASLLLITGCSSKSEQPKPRGYYTEEEFKKDEPEILSYIDYVKKLNLKPKVNSSLPFPVSEYYLNVIKEEFSYNINLNSGKIYSDFKYEKGTLKDFLNRYEFYRPNNLDIFVGNTRVSYTRPSSLTLKNLDTENVVNINRLYSTFLTEPLIFKNKDLLVKVWFDHSLAKYSTRGDFYITITNLTNKFIDISTISVYVDSEINSMQLPIKLPPKGTIKNRVLQVSNYDMYKQVNSLNDTRVFAGAVEYSIDQKNESLFEEKELKFK